MIGLTIPSISAQEQVPSWVKNTAGWWATDAISETEFVNAIEFLIQNNIITIQNDVSSLLLTWDEVINDANYANEGSLKIKAHASNVGPISHNLSLLVHYNADADNFTFYDQIVFDLLNSGITLFAITGDEKYLDQARDVANSIEEHLLLDDDRVVGFAPVAETYLLAHNRDVLQDISYLSLIHI